MTIFLGGEARQQNLPKIAGNKSEKAEGTADNFQQCYRHSKRWALPLLPQDIPYHFIHCSVPTSEPRLVTSCLPPIVPRDPPPPCRETREKVFQVGRGKGYPPMGISVPRNLLFPSPMVVRGVNPPRLLPLGGGRPPTRGIPIQPCRPPRVKCISATATAALQCRSLPPDVPTGRPRPLPPALGRRRRRPPVGCGRRAGGGRRRRGHAVGRAHAAASRLASMAHMIGGGGG